MLNNIRLIRPAFAAVFTALFFVSLGQVSDQTPIPIDPDVRIGKLANGFTYYLRKNAYPEKRIEFRLAVNAGSMQEEDDQQGLAHFTEHLAFNGSEHFEKNELVDFLQSIGVQFGSDLNAYTSFEETVYILPIPSDDPAIVSKGLTVLEDWAFGLSLNPEEIDKERGVIIEEWRIGQGARQRMRDEYFPVLFQDSRYAERLPIGKKDIIENAPYETFRNFYEDWYRPDLMALIAVGDIDVDQMEKEIKKRFGKAKKVKKPKAKASNEVPAHEKTLVSLTKDVENPYTAVQLIYKKPKSSFNTLADLRNNYLLAMYSRMLNARLEELTQKSPPAFIYGSSSFGSFVRGSDSYYVFAVTAEDKVVNSLRTLVTENERIKLHGFTQGELDRTIQDLKTELQSLIKEKDKSESKNYVSEYVDHFLEQEPIPGIDFEASFFEKMAPTVTLKELNEIAKHWITDSSRVVIVTGVDKEGVVHPTEKEILEVFEQIDPSTIEPYNDEVSGKALLEEIPQQGEILHTEEISIVDATSYTLSNGAKVVIKQTDFKNDEILLSALSPGGYSLYEDSVYFSASNAGTVVSLGGINDFSLVQLGKLLAGKNVDISLDIDDLSEGISGSSTPEDFETLLQLVHLYFTKPRKDQEAFESFISRNKSLYKNIKSNPDYYYQDQLARILSQNHLRGDYKPSPAQMDSIRLDDAFRVYEERFDNAADFTFFFVGNIDVDKDLPLIAQYIGSLPSTDSKETWKDEGIRPPKGPLDKKLYSGSAEKSEVTLEFDGEKSLSRDERYVWSAFGDILSNELIDLLRESESGVYSVGARASYSDIPYPHYNLSVNFPCSPENVEKLINTTLETIEKIQTEGVSDEAVKKVKEADRLNREENLKRNNYWLRQLRNYDFYGFDINSFYEYEKRIEALNGEDIQQIAKDLIDTKKPLQIVLYPEKEE